MGRRLLLRCECKMQTIKSLADLWRKHEDKTTISERGVSNVSFCFIWRIQFRGKPRIPQSIRGKENNSRLQAIKPINTKMIGTSQGFMIEKSVLDALTG